MKIETKKFLLSCIFGALLLLTVPEFIRALVYVGGHFKHYWYFLGGGVLYAAVALTVLKTNLGHLQRRQHESIHETACMIMLRPIEYYKVTKNGGEVSYRGDRNMFITLSPYCFPFVTYFFFLIQLMVSPKYPYYAILPGFLFFFFLHAVYKQLRPHQPDLDHYGHSASYLFIADFLLFNVSVILYAVKMNIWKGFLFYFTDLWGLIRAVLS
jgi:hypothetical protein